MVDDHSRERRSPENFHPPRLPIVEGAEQDKPQCIKMGATSKRSKLIVDEQKDAAANPDFIRSPNKRQKVGKIDRQSFLKDKQQLEESVRGFRKHGKLDQNVLSESQMIPRGDDADQNNDNESQDFDFDDFGDDNHAVVEQRAIETVPARKPNQITKSALSNILTERAKHDFQK